MSNPAATPSESDSNPAATRMLTLSEAVKVATVSKATLQRRLKAGQIPGAVQTGGEAGPWQIPEQSLIDAGLADETAGRDMAAELAKAHYALEIAIQAEHEHAAERRRHAAELEQLATAKDDEHRRTLEQLRLVLLDRDAERQRHAAELERLQADGDRAAAMYERQLESLTGTVDALRQLVEGVAALMPARPVGVLVESTGKRRRWRRQR